MTPEAVERVVERQALLRSANEMGRAIEQRLGLDEVLADAEAPLVWISCECGQPDCWELLAVPLREYEVARANARAFLVLPGHCVEGVERIVERGARFHRVEMLDHAARVAERLYERRGSRDG